MGTEHFVRLVRDCIRLGYRPNLWKTVKRMVILKINKPDYSQVRTCRITSLLNAISRLVEKTAADS